jgi:hypothetical protein
MTIQNELKTPDGKVKAYRKRVISQFTKVDNQGDLFSGFNYDPICTINWASPSQVGYRFFLKYFSIKFQVQDLKFLLD